MKRSQFLSSFVGLFVALFSKKTNGKFPKGVVTHDYITDPEEWYLPESTAELNEASLEQALIDIKKFENDIGAKISIRPTHIIIPQRRV